MSLLTWVIKYTVLDSFIGSYNNVNNQPEGRVVSIWTTILSEAFPVREDYVQEPQCATRGKYTDITVSQWQRDNNDTLQRKPFLIIQVKRYGFDLRQSIWLAAQKQLSEYLKVIARSNPGRIFGIIAIGRHVCFYEFKRGVQEVRFLSGTPTMYEIRAAVNMVRRKLMVIKTNH